MSVHPAILPLAGSEFITIAHQLHLAELPFPFFCGTRRPVPVYRIVRLEGDGNYTRLYFDDGSCLMLSVTLKRVGSRLPQNVFVRAHRKNLVNLLYLQEFRSNYRTFEVRLTNGDVVKVSRRKAPHFYQQIEVFRQELNKLKQGAA